MREVELSMQSNISFFDLLEQVRGLTAKAKMVYLLLHYAEQEQRDLLGQDAMAQELELSSDSVNRGLKELRQHGLVTWKNRGLTLPSIYQIVRYPGDDQASSEEPKS